MYSWVFYYCDELLERITLKGRFILRDPASESQFITVSCGQKCSMVGQYGIPQLCMFFYGRERKSERGKKSSIPLKGTLPVT